MLPCRASLLSSPLSSPSAAIAVRRSNDDFGNARFLPCPYCHAQAWICSWCDRWNVCCSPDCAQAWRRELVRRYGARYRQTEKGRLAGAARGRRFRLVHRDDVTHQSSPNVVLEPIVGTAAAAPSIEESSVGLTSAGAPAGSLAAAGHSNEEADNAPIPTIDPTVPAVQTPVHVRCTLCGRPCRPEVRLEPYRCRGRHPGRPCPYRGGHHPAPRRGIGPRQALCPGAAVLT